MMMVRQQKLGVCSKEDHVMETQRGRIQWKAAKVHLVGLLSTQISEPALLPAYCCGTPLSKQSSSSFIGGQKRVTPILGVPWDRPPLPLPLLWLPPSTPLLPLLHFTPAGNSVFSHQPQHHLPTSARPARQMPPMATSSWVLHASWSIHAARRQTITCYIAGSRSPPQPSPNPPH